MMNGKEIILASHQPDFFPYMGYFYKIFKSDVFVFSDDVQFSKKGMHNYNTILTKNGTQRITLPISYHMKPIKDIEIAATKEDLLRLKKTIKEAYSKAPHFEEVWCVIERMFDNALSAPRKSLSEFNEINIIALCAFLGIKDKRFVLASTLKYDGRRDDRIINICRKFDADVYYSGRGAADYHIPEHYTEKGIELRYTDYQPLKYPQYKGEIIDNLSVIDYLMNCGFNLPKEWI